MKALNSLLFSIVFFIVGNASGQNIKGRVWGEYSASHIIQPVRKPDSLPSIGLPKLEVYALMEFDNSRTLKLNWNRRFTITNSRAIPAYGLQTDNPTIHGSYKVNNDTLILTYRYSIQHFNKLSPKSRVKRKYNQGNRTQPVKRFARSEKEVFKISNYGFWTLKE